MSSAQKKTEDLAEFMADYDSAYGTGAFAEQMAASRAVPPHLQSSNAASLLLKSQDKQMEQDLKRRELQERQALLDQERQQHLERQRLAKKQVEQAQAQKQAEAADVRSASKGLFGGKRTQRQRKRKVVRKRSSRRYKRKPKSQSQSRCRRV